MTAKYLMIHEFKKLNKDDLVKVRNHYCYTKSIWFTKQVYYKKYDIFNIYQLEKFKKSFEIYRLINDRFEYQFDNNTCYIKMESIKNQTVNYITFLNLIEKFIISNYKIKNTLVCYEDLLRKNYFVEKNQICLIDESKVLVCSSKEMWYNRIIYSLVEGYKNEIQNDGSIFSYDHDKKIFDIIKNLSKLID